MQQNVDNLVKLAKININYPASCLYNLGKNKKLPMVALTNIVQRVEAEVSSASALDIYYYLFEVVDEHESLQKDSLTPTTRLTLQETIAETLFMDFHRFDYPRELADS